MATTKIKPLNDKVLLKLLDPQTKTSGGILLPDNAADEQYAAEVIAVGPGKVNDKGTRTPIEIKIGQKVLIRGKWAGDTVTYDGVEYKIISESEILASIE